MKIWVSPLSKIHDTAAQARPQRVVSLLAPGDVFPTIDDVDPDYHHKTALHDIRAPSDGMITPGQGHVADIISFLEQWTPDTTLLVHCWAGISRSTATAFIAACMKNPQTEEGVIADALKAASPTAFPNTLIVSIADDILGREGRLKAAAARICADEGRAHRVSQSDEGTPFHIPAQFR